MTAATMTNPFLHAGSNTHPRLRLARSGAALFFRFIRPTITSAQR